MTFSCRTSVFLALVMLASWAWPQDGAPAPVPPPPPSQSAPQQAPQPAQPPAAAQPSNHDGTTTQDSTHKAQDGTGTPSSKGAAQGTSNDRLFYTLPNFLTLEHAGKVPPLTTKQKFAVVTRGSFDYVQVPWYGFLAAVSQAENSEPGYGQGAAGYGKRFASSFADGTIENYMTGAIFPALLREDPRYFELGEGSVFHRTLYAMSRNLITRTDSGKNRFNFSEILGGGLSAAISTYTYHPSSKLISTPTGVRFIPSDRTIANTASVWATQYGYDTMTLVVKEFWPDIRRWLNHKHTAEAANPTK